MVILTLGEMLALSRTGRSAPGLRPRPTGGRFMGVLSLCWWWEISPDSVPGLALDSHHPDMLWLACGIFGLLAAVIVSWGARNASPRA